MVGKRGSRAVVIRAAVLLGADAAQEHDVLHTALADGLHGRGAAPLLVDAVVRRLEVLRQQRVHRLGESARDAITIASYGPVVDGDRSQGGVRVDCRTTWPARACRT